MFQISYQSSKVQRQLVSKGTRKRVGIYYNKSFQTHTDTVNYIVIYIKKVMHVVSGIFTNFPHTSPVLPHTAHTFLTLQKHCPHTSTTISPTLQLHCPTLPPCVPHTVPTLELHFPTLPPCSLHTANTSPTLQQRCPTFPPWSYTPTCISPTLQQHCPMLSLHFYYIAYTTPHNYTDPQYSPQFTTLFKHMYHLTASHHTQEIFPTESHKEPSCPPRYLTSTFMTSTPHSPTLT